MTKIELFLILGACLVPILAFLFVLPKKIKSKKKVEVKTEEYVPETKSEQENKGTGNDDQKPLEIKVESNKKNDDFNNPFEKDLSNEISGYREYMERKRNSITRPNKIELPKDFKDLSESFFENRRRRRESQHQESQDITNLSDDIQALLIAGILDRKF